MPELFRIYLTLGFILFVLYYIAFWLVTKRMRDFHNEAWSSKLGQSSLLLNNSLQTSFLSLRYFIFTNRYKELSDETLNKMVLVVRILFAVFMLNFAWGISMVFWPRS